MTRASSSRHASVEISSAWSLLLREAIDASAWRCSRITSRLSSCECSVVLDGWMLKKMLESSNSVGVAMIGVPCRIAGKAGAQPQTRRIGDELAPPRLAEDYALQIHPCSRLVVRVIVMKWDRVRPYSSQRELCFWRCFIRTHRCGYTLKRNTKVFVHSDLQHD
jgi:hypothetical protein